MKKMILDLDTGVDDALAISYALGSPEIELIGITGTYGNVLVEQGVRNALAVTDLLGHPEVKVYQGLPHSSTTDHFEVLPISAFIHGDNGIGDVEIPDSNRSVETESAGDFIIGAVKAYGKDLIYVPTGPMTNIEAALKKAPEIKDEIGQIVLMGGALTVPGNCNACMEANISQDPEAADYLFRSGAPTTMIGLDVTLQTLLTYKETQQWRDLGTKAGKFLADMTDFYIKAYETTSPHLGGCGLHDPLAVGVAVDVDKAGSYPFAPGVDDPGGLGLGQRLHRGDFAAGHRHVGPTGGTACAVVHGAAPDDEIKHGISFF